jgi:hypothetical protein
MPYHSKREMCNVKQTGEFWCFFLSLHCNSKSSSQGMSYASFTVIK